MFKVTDLFKFLKSKYSIAYFWHYFIVLLVLGVFIFAFLLMRMPIASAQYSKIQQFAQMGQYPQTQGLAQSMLKEPQINKRQYLRLMHAYTFEQQRIQQYPALDPDHTIQ